MKNLVIVLVTVLVGFSAQAQNSKKWEPIIVSMGLSAGNATNAYMSINKQGGFGGEFSFGAGTEGNGYVGGLVTYDLFSRKTKLTKKKGFNIKLGVGFEAEEKWTTESPFKTEFYKEKTLKGVDYAVQAKVTVRYKRIETSVIYSAHSGVSVGFGVILKKF